MPESTTLTPTTGTQPVNMEGARLRFDPGDAEITFGEVTDDAILALVEKYSTLECATPADRKAVADATRDLGKIRRAVDGRRKELKEQASAWNKAVESEAQRFISLIRDIENPLVAKRKAYDRVKDAEKKERQRKEKERADKMRARITSYTERSADACKLGDSKEMAKRLYELEIDLPTPLEFDEFYHQASGVYRASMAALKEAIENAVHLEEMAVAEAAQRAEQEAERERLKAERAELERQKKEAQDELQRMRDETQAEVNKLRAEAKALKDAEEARKAAEQAKEEAAAQEAMVIEKQLAQKAADAERKRIAALEADAKAKASKTEPVYRLAAVAAVEPTTGTLHEKPPVAVEVGESLALADDEVELKPRAPVGPNIGSDSEAKHVEIGPVIVRVSVKWAETKLYSGSTVVEAQRSDLADGQLTEEAAIRLIEPGCLGNEELINRAITVLETREE